MQVVDANGNVFGQGLEITGIDGKPKVPVINTDITIGTTVINGGVSGRLLFDDAGVVGETNGVHWNTAGFLGIGTIIPVAPTGYNGITINSTTGAYTWFQTGGVTKYSIGTEGNVNYHNLVAGTSFLIRSGGNNYFNLVQSTGNVQIGTTTDAGYKLDVNGTAAIRGITNIIGGTLRIASTGTLTQPSYITSHSDGGWNYTTYTHERGAGVHYFTSNNGSASIFSASAREGVNINVSSLTTGNPFSISGTVNASSAIARGQLINTTLVAAANNDVLVGLDVQPTFTNGAFTGLSNFGLRISTSTQAGNNGGQIAVRATDGGIGVIGIQGGGWGSLGLWGPTRYTVSATPDIRVRGNDGGIMIENFLLIGATTNAGYKLDVNGTTRVTGILRAETYVQLGTNLNTVIGSTSTGTTWATGPALLYGSANLNSSTIYAHTFFTGAFNATSSSQGVITTTGATFNPTSGTAVFNAFNLPFTINQTGGANGITRGIYVNPTLTAAADFRAIETTAGNIIFNGGNIGVGISAPVVRYHQSQTQGILARYDITNANADQNRAVWEVYSNTAATPDFFGRFGFKFEGGANNAARQFQLHVGDNTTPRFVVNGSGNVLIGTSTDAGYKLEVVGITRLRATGYSQALQITDVSNSTTLSLGSGATNGGNPLINSSTGTLQINPTTNGTFALTFEQIKLTLPQQYKIYGENGSNYLTLNEGGGSTDIRLWGESSTANIRIATNNAERLRITTTGNILIGTTTDAGYKLNVNGGGYFEGNLKVNGAITASIPTPNAYVCNIGLAADQSIASGSDVQIDFIDIDDTNNWYDPTTKRFTPTIAGYYHVDFTVWFDAATVSTGQYNIQIRKNASTVLIVQQPNINNGTGQSLTGSKLIYFNGTTDYIDFTAYQSTGVNRNLQAGASSSGTYASIFLLAV